MFNRAYYENSQPGGIPALEVVEPTPPREGVPPRFVPLRLTELRGEVAGPVASLRLIQTFGYSREECHKILEAIYRFPLPGDAAVTNVRVRFGDVEIRAELKRREQAEADYEAARREGRQAALATRESPDVFTLQVAGLQPDQEVTVETFYLQLARPEGSGWSLRVPLTTSPRYVRSDERTSRHAQGQPLMLLRDPGHRFALDIQVRAASAVTSATHALQVTEAGNAARVRLKEGEVLPDRDCLLAWHSRRERDRPALQVLTHADENAEEVYFLALLAPPAQPDYRRAVPREVILLVDHSGSMHGPKWEAADWAVKRFLADLSPQDVFALGLFHNATRWFAAAPESATPERVQAAIAFLEQNRDSGGTELGVALEQALGLQRAAGERTRHVLILTDAEVTDAGRILRLADEERKRAGSPDERRRVSVLCIDAAPNSFLALELAERGGGVARFLTSNPEEGDITTALDEILADWSAPLLAGLRLGVNRPTVETTGRETLAGEGAGWSGIDLGDLPAGRAVWAAGRVPRGRKDDLAFRVRSGSREVAAADLDLATEVERLPALKPLFGARRVLGLEFLIHSGHQGKELRDALARLGYDADQVLGSGKSPTPKVYAENVRADAETALRDLLAREALDYGLASSETAFVAVRTEAGKPVEGTVAVANALPAGWSEEFLASPMLASSAPASGALYFMAASPAPPAGYAGPGRVVRTLQARLSGPSPSMAAPLGGVAPSQSMADFAAVHEAPPAAPVFSGVPQFTAGEAVLFDSARPEDASRLPGDTTFTRLRVRLPGAPAPADLDPELALLIFVEDLAAPRARVRLADLLRQGGERPLNLLRRAGQVVRIVLVDPSGAWAQSAPKLEVMLG
jgi:Ca-activated chloride channel family protein